MLFGTEAAAVLLALGHETNEAVLRPDGTEAGGDVQNDQATVG